nr:GspH/FimT family pseudopilin [uncultured Ralstonia sp.]
MASITSTSTSTIAFRAAAPRNSRHAGFTLIEVVTTVTILAILLTIATPYFRDFVLTQRAKAGAYDLISSLLYARSEALKRNTNVVVTPTNGGWQNGWSVTVGTTALAKHEAVPGLTVTAPAGNLVYTSSGRVSAAAISSFSIAASGSSATPTCVKVELSGMPTSQAGAC